MVLTGRSVIATNTLLFLCFGIVSEAAVRLGGVSHSVCVNVDRSFR